MKKFVNNIATQLLTDLREGKIAKIDIDIIRKYIKTAQREPELQRWNFNPYHFEVAVTRAVVEKVG